MPFLWKRSGAKDLQMFDVRSGWRCLELSHECVTNDIYISMYICIYIYICISLYMSIYIMYYRYIHTQTCTYIYIHIDMCIQTFRFLDDV